MKKKTVFFCTDCGNEHSKWMGQCNFCSAWNTIQEKTITITKGESRAARAILSDAVELVSLGDVEASSKKSKRLLTGLSELDSALSGGLIKDQVTLISGEPGVGKSTLLLQVIVNLNKQGVKTLYASGEESASQIASRASRLFPVKKDYSDVKFVSSPAVQDLIALIDKEKPEFVVVDSVQTIYDESLTGLPGSIGQVKAATSALVSVAKKFGFVLVLVGHINKDGAIAGPKVLEHLVDTVIQFDGERGGMYRVIRVLKNRFGSTGEVGLLVMTESGLEDMSMKHNIFDSEEPGVGTARTLVLEGNRPLIVQVQALVVDTVFAYPKRVSEGVPVSRVQLIVAILEKFARVKLGDKDVYIRTAGNYKLQNTISDLAIAAAILSSLTSTPIKPGSLFVGEMSLGGGIRLPGGAANNMKAVKKFGLKSLITTKFFNGAIPIGVEVTKLKGIWELSKFFKK